MAEKETDSGEKELEASEQKRQRAREEGDVPQSKEANTLALIVGIVVAALMLQVSTGPAVFSDFSALLYHSDAFADDLFAATGDQTRSWLSQALVKFSPLMLVLLIAVLVALVAQRAIAVSAKKLKPNIQNISPVENIKKRYGPRGLVDFVKDTAKLLFAVAIAAVFLIQFARDYYGSSAIQPGQFADFTFRQTLKLILFFFVFQLILAVIDLPVQRQLHGNRLKMTREEMKKELKQTEGDPHLKQSRREKASKISRGQMLSNVKSATVVMVNPEHYAVALKWEPESQRAPVCVAKGVDHLAARIRDIALANDVPIYRDPPCTRSIYRLVDIDEEIHPEHFAAVAAAIQFVERVRKHVGDQDG